MNPKLIAALVAFAAAVIAGTVSYHQEGANPLYKVNGGPIPQGMNPLYKF